MCSPQHFVSMHGDSFIMFISAKEGLIQDFYKGAPQSNSYIIIFICIEIIHILF